VLVDFLLSLALVVADVAWIPVSTRSKCRCQSRLTRSFLRAVSSDGTDDGVLLADDTVLGSLSVALSLSSLVLGLAGGVLLLARLLPGSSAGDIADGLDDVALGAVELTRGLATGRKFASVTEWEWREKLKAYLGSL
jgi:hypothetical protein